MSDTFDCAGLFKAAFAEFDKHPGDLQDGYDAADAYLRTRIEAAFVPVAEYHQLEHQLDNLQDDLCEPLQQALARAEAAEARVKVLDEALRALITEREGHFSTQAAWDAARQALGAEHGK